MDNEIGNTDYNTEIGDEPPEFSIGTIITMFRERGFVDTLDDEVMGPHVHLIVLLSIIFLIAIIVGIVQLAL